MEIFASVSKQGTFVGKAIVWEVVLASARALMAFGIVLVGLAHVATSGKDMWILLRHIVEHPRFAGHNVTSRPMVGQSGRGPVRRKNSVPSRTGRSFLQDLSAARLGIGID
jgi:hypothetical protein